MQKTKLRAYVSVIFVNAMWGLSFIASKVGLESGFTPFALALVRYVITCAVMLPILRLKEGHLRLPRAGLLPLFLSSLCGISLYFLFEYMGLERTTASNASLIIAAVPVFTMLYGALARRQRYRPICWAGVALSLVGVYFVVRYGGDEGAGSLTGNLFMICACLLWVGYIELTDALLRKYPYTSLELTCWQSAFGALALVPLSLTQPVNLALVAPAGWAAAAFLALVCSALCYLLYADSIAALSPIRTALFINLNPLAAMLGGALLLGEKMTAPQIAGGAVILVSIFLVNYFMAQPRAAKEATRHA